MATQFGIGGMATDNEGLTEGEKRVIFSDAVDRDPRRKKSLENGEPVENFIETTGGDQRKSA